MRRYDVLLTDADNTLFDFNAAEREALCKTCAFFGVHADDAMAAAYARINDRLWGAYERREITQAALRVERFVQFLAWSGLEGDASTWCDRYVDALAQEGILLPDALETVRAIADIMPIVVVTNGIARVQRSRIARSPLAPYVHALVISEEVGVAKPDARMVEAGLSQSGVEDRTRALFLGDSLTADIMAANNAGVDSCWFNPHHQMNSTPAKPTHTIDALPSVLPLIMRV